MTPRHPISAVACMEAHKVATFHAPANRSNVLLAHLTDNGHLLLEWQLGKKPLLHLEVYSFRARFVKGARSDGLLLDLDYTCRDPSWHLLGQASVCLSDTFPLLEGVPTRDNVCVLSCQAGSAPAWEYQTEASGSRDPLFRRARLSFPESFHILPLIKSEPQCPA